MATIAELQIVQNRHVLIAKILIKINDVVKPYQPVAIRKSEKFISRLIHSAPTQLTVEYEDFSRDVLTLIGDEHDVVHFVDTDNFVYEITSNLTKPHALIIRSKHTVVMGRNLSIQRAILYDNYIYSSNESPSTQNYALFSPKYVPQYVLQYMCADYKNLILYGRKIIVPRPIKHTAHILRLVTKTNMYGFTLLYGFNRALCIHRSHQGSFYTMIETDWGYVVNKSTGNTNVILIPTSAYKLLNTITGELEEPHPISTFDPTGIIPSTIVSSANQVFHFSTVKPTATEVTLRYTMKNHFINFIYESDEYDRFVLVQVNVD